MSILKAAWNTSKFGKLFTGTKAKTTQIGTNLGLNNTFLLSGVASWRDMSELAYLLKAYCENPIVQAVINIKAEAFSNIKFSVKNLANNEITPLNEYQEDKGKLKSLIGQPNPLQSTFEWLRQYKVNQEVFGNGYAYASVPVGFERSFSYQDINVINNLPSYFVTPTLTGKWLDATTKEEIIKHYELRGINGKVRKLETNTVFQTNGINIKLDARFTEGVSKLVALQRPISNIDKAYESRNVLITRRGALGILTSEKKDAALGHLPLQQTEIDDVQDSFKNYGLLEDQYTQVISPVPLKYQRMAMSVKDLMLFEEIESDAIAIANAFGVPELLAKYYLKGGTFANMDASERRLYDSTIIPESKDWLTNFNNFLKTKELNIELLGDFDHLNILQLNKKEQATTKKLKQETALAAFKIGAIVYNDYLAAIDMANDDKIGELRIWDLSKDQLNAIGITQNNTVQNGTQNSN
jgi:hypothetical protein